MFVPLDQEPAGLRPSSSAISENDWNVLARYWYPVALSWDVKDAPVSAKLLDVDLVVYRIDGAVAVALDVCPHRHVRLSAGKIENVALVCPFHGLAFDASGQCVRVPALGAERKLPKSYHAHTVRCEERYGLIWACLDPNSTEKRPTLSVVEELGENWVYRGLMRDWPVSAPRQIENFIDQAHLPIVHPTTLGGDPNAELTRPKVELTNDGLIITTRFGPHVEGYDKVLDYKYEITLPFMIMLELKRLDGSIVTRMYDMPVPISAHQCRVFNIYSAWEEQTSAEPRPSFNDKVNLEDIAVLSHMARPDLPLNEKWEIHLPVDNISIAYRKRLQDLGLGWRAS